MMEARLALSNGLKRGWLSYADLTNLLQSNKMMGGFKGVGFLFVQASFYCTVLYTSFISLWIWTLLTINSRSVVTPQVTSNVSSHIAHLPQLNSGDVGPVMLTASDDNSSSHYLHVTIDNMNETLNNSSADKEQEPPTPPVKKPTTYSVMTLLETVLFLSTAAVDTGPPPPQHHNDPINVCTNCGRNIDNTQQQYRNPTHTATVPPNNPTVSTSFPYESLNPTCSLRDHMRSAVSPVVGYHAYQSPPHNLLYDVTHYHSTLPFQPHQHHRTNLPPAFDSRACLTSLAAYLSPVLIRHWSVVSSAFCYLSILFLSAFVGYFSGRWYGVKDQFAFQ